jgi:uncharacterized PurR-regulated membrane protein YhhQ (DUF165 family)
MKNDPERPRFLERIEGIRVLLWLLYAVCAVLVLAELVVHRHAEHPFETHFGFYAVYGFLSYSFIVLAAKLLRVFLMRPEDYYDRDRDG